MKVHPTAAADHTALASRCRQPSVRRCLQFAAPGFIPLISFRLRAPDAATGGQRPRFTAARHARGMATAMPAVSFLGVGPNVTRLEVAGTRIRRPGFLVIDRYAFVLIYDDYY